MEKNKDLLVSCIGSKYVSVHLHGSMLLGLGTRRIAVRERGGETRPSDIDFMMFIGKVGKNNMPDYLKALRFTKESNFQREFNQEGHGIVVNMPEIIEQVKEICIKASSLQKMSFKEYEKFLAIYKIAVLFGSDSLFQNKPGQEAKWRNEILKVLLENQSGEKVWDEGIRECFNRYMAGYENNSWIPLEEVRKKHKIRFDMTFNEISSKRRIREEHKISAKEALSKKLANIQLPKFRVIQESLKDKLV